jgi:LuxR family maltose regulon positive regulatory protein
LKDLPEDKPMLRMRVSVILGLAHFRAGDVSEASESFSQAITAAQKANLGFVATPLICNLAEVQIVQGQLRQAHKTCEQAMEMAIVDGTPTSVAGFPGLELGKILYEQNDLPAAEKYVSEALALLGRSGTTDSFGIGHALLARIRQARRDNDGALAAIQRAIQIAQSFEITRISTLIGAYQARIWLAQGKLEQATRWTQDYEQLGATEYLREFEDLTLVRVRLAQDEPFETLALLDELLPPAEATGRTGTVIEIWALYALALQAQGDLNGALAALERAVQLAKPEGYARVFIEEGQPMAHLLHKAANLDISPSYVGQLLVAMEYGTEAKQAIGMSSLVEPLSERELEVLALIADGLSNPEIAQRLFISLSTVKSHARNIYGKLGVHKRKEAVARAKTLGILSA